MFSRLNWIVGQPSRSNGDAGGSEVRDLEDKAGEFRFYLKAANGEVIASSEGYKRRLQPRRASSRSRPTRPVPR
jgi:hypothetical protein